MSSAITSFIEGFDYECFLYLINKTGVRSVFRQNREFYFAKGITAIEITDIIEDASVPGLWIGRALLVNLNNKGERVSVEHNAYQIVALENKE